MQPAFLSVLTSCNFEEITTDSDQLVGKFSVCYLYVKSLL